MKVKVSWSQSHQTTSYTHNKPSSHTSCSASARRSQLPGERGIEKAAVETPPFGKRETGPLSVRPMVELLKRQRSGKHDHPHTCTHLCVITTGFQARSRGGRWSWTLSPEEIMSREVELGCESWTSFASGCSSAIVRCTSHRAMVRRGDTTLTLPLFWWQSMVSPDFFGQYPRSSLHSFIPSPPSPSPRP